MKLKLFGKEAGNQNIEQTVPNNLIITCFDVNGSLTKRRAENMLNTNMLKLEGCQPYISY